MSLRKQIFVSFFIVALFPLIVFSVFLLQMNVMLAFDLHRQNLRSATSIQADVIEESLNRLMIRANRLANASVIRNVFLPGMLPEDLLKDKAVSEELLQFTDETIDSVALFALANTNGSLLYASGSNSDVQRLKSELRNITVSQKQYVCEIPLSKKTNNLAIITPIMVQGQQKGMFIVAYNNEFFLKAISGHQQIESTNAFIFCRTHQSVVESKFEITGSFENFAEKTMYQNEGVFEGKVNGERSVAYFRGIVNSPWIIVNIIPGQKIYSQIFSYALGSLLAFLVILLVVILLARWQSTRILQPLNSLLDSVENFFMSGASRFSCSEITRKTEIGYLAGKFAGMASDITVVQAKLKESNYLYRALLHAAYEMHITIDYTENIVTTSAEELASFFNECGNISAPDKVLRFLEHSGAIPGNCDSEVVRNIIFGVVTIPTETEVCCNMGLKREESWYRIIAVPIIDANGKTKKMVLHFKDVTASKKEVLHLLHTSQRDPLCNLLNKKAFISVVQQFVVTASGTNSVFFVDLDNFKEVNDNLGHSVGDEVLLRTANVLSDQFRSTDFVGRYGGDEFVIFASGMTRASAERKSAALVKELVTEYKNETGKTVHTSASVGVFLSDNVPDIEVMVRYADAAMYRAKQKGKSGFYITEEGDSFNA